MNAAGLEKQHQGYLQQDMPNHVFDCHIFPPKSQGKTAEAAKTGSIPKLKVLVAGMKQQLINDFQTAIKDAGLIPDHIVPGIIGPVNAFEMSLPEVFANESVALVDIGFKHSSVCVVDRGELVLSRMVNIGGDKLTAGLAEAMNITYAEAEGIKVGMAPEVRPCSKLKCNHWGANCARPLTSLNINRTAPCRRSMSPAARPSRR